MRENERKAPASEETDQLERSVKTPKETVRDDCHVDDPMPEKNDSVEEAPVGVEGPADLNDIKMKPLQERKLVSYKDKILSFNGMSYESDSDEEDWKERQRREEEEDGEEEVEVTGNPQCPIYNFSKSQHKKECESWKGALVIKLLGKRMAPSFLIFHLQKLWNLVGTFEQFNLDNGHIILKFSYARDYHHVLHEGPWMVLDHYLVVQRWRLFFNPNNDSVKKLAVWIRIGGLPMEFYSS